MRGRGQVWSPDKPYTSCLLLYPLLTADRLLKRQSAVFKEAFTLVLGYVNKHVHTHGI